MLLRKSAGLKYVGSHRSVHSRPIPPRSSRYDRSTRKRSSRQPLTTAPPALPPITPQVFRCADPEKGWGLRCLETIPAGSFVACYLGEVLTDRSVDDRGRQTHDDYVFSLDFARPGGSGGGGGDGPLAGLAGSPTVSPTGNTKWGSPLSFSASPRNDGGGGGGATAAASLNARPPAAPPTWSVETGGRGGRSSLATPRNSNARTRKKTKRCSSGARSPLAAAAGAVAAAAGGRVVGAGEGLATELDLEQDAEDFPASPEQEKALDQFLAATNCSDRKRAAFFLRGAGDNVEVAVNHFFDAPVGADPDVADDAGGDANPGGPEDDADDEREESEDPDGAVAAAAAVAAAPVGSGSEVATSPPAELSEEARRRFLVHDHNERERQLYLRQRTEEEAEEGEEEVLRVQARAIGHGLSGGPVPTGDLPRSGSLDGSGSGSGDPSGTRLPRVMAFPEEKMGKGQEVEEGEGACGGAAPSAAAAVPAAAGASAGGKILRDDMETGEKAIDSGGASAVAASSPAAAVPCTVENTAVSPPSSPAQVLWQETDDTLESSSGELEAGMRAGAVASAREAGSCSFSATAAGATLHVRTSRREGGGGGMEASRAAEREPPTSKWRFSLAEACSSPSSFSSGAYIREGVVGAPWGKGRQVDRQADRRDRQTSTQKDGRGSDTESPPEVQTDAETPGLRDEPAERPERQAERISGQILGERERQAGKRGKWLES